MKEDLLNPRTFFGGCYFGVEKPNDTPNMKVTRGKPIKWTEYIVPSDDQYDESSCVGRAWAGWLEAMIRYTKGKDSIPENYQIDGALIWKHARQKWWRGTYDDGIYVHQGALAAIDLGIVPPDTKLKSYASNWPNLKLLLMKAPVVLGHMITDGWFTTLPNGCINHTLKGKDSLGGHAILDLETIVNSGQEAVIFQNSWGVKKWGYHGLGIMNSEYWEKTVDNCLYQMEFQESWNNFDEWKLFLVEKHYV